MKQSRIREWEENNRRFEMGTYSKKKARERHLKMQGRDASYKLKSKLAVIRRNIQHVTGTLQ